MPVITVVGNVVADIMARPVDAVPRTGSLHPDEVRYFAGGCANNVAMVLAKLAVTPRLVACVGDDPLGDLLRLGWQRAGMSDEFVERVADQPTGVAIVLVDSDGERRFISTPGANELLRPDRLTEATLAGSAALHVAGFFAAPGLEDGTLAARLAEARARGLLVTLDMVGGSARERRAALFPLLPHLDWLLLNEDEAEKVTGEATPDAMIAALRAHGASTILLKQGERGGIVIEGDQRWRWQAAPCVPLDTTGAGDTFIATLLAAHQRGLPLREGIAWATTAAALTVEALGAHGAWRGWDDLHARRAATPTTGGAPSAPGSG